MRLISDLYKNICHLVNVSPSGLQCSVFYKANWGHCYSAYRNSVNNAFLFKMSLFISIWTEILHMQIKYHRLIYNCMFELLRLENKSGISCKIK